MLLRAFGKAPLPARGRAIAQGSLQQPLCERPPSSSASFSQLASWRQQAQAGIRRLADRFTDGEKGPTVPELLASA